MILQQQSPSMPQSPKYTSYFNSMIVNVLLKSLGRPNMYFVSMIIRFDDLLQSLGRTNMCFI